MALIQVKQHQSEFEEQTNSEKEIAKKFEQMILHAKLVNLDSRSEIVKDLRAVLFDFAAILSKKYCHEISSVVDWMAEWLKKK